MTIKLGTHTSYDKRTTPIDFQGQGSKVEVTRYTLLLNLVNMIQTEPFQLWPSNLVRTLLMTRGWHLYIFKVMGQRSKINPFYIANYKVISLFKSPVGRILQRWRCFGILPSFNMTVIWWRQFYRPPHWKDASSKVSHSCSWLNYKAISLWRLIPPPSPSSPSSCPLPLTLSALSLPGNIVILPWFS